MVVLKKLLKVLAPIIVGIIIALIPPPAGLKPGAWYYFALFAAVITGVITEPIPSAAIGLIGVTIVAATGLVYAKPADAIKWALTGFSDPTVWLIFVAFLFGLGYAKTGLGKRIALLLIRFLGRNTLGLGYAIAATDLALAPFMPSNTARSGGTIYPIISNIPPLYGSLPGTGTERKIGSYIMWTAFATTCITSSMFLTGLAPNLLASSLAAKAGVKFDWLTWFLGFSAVGILLFALTPLLIYKVYPPEVKRSPEAAKWASQELVKIGSISVKEVVFLALVIMALVLWIFGGDYINATTVGLLVVVLMLVLRIVAWDDILGYKSAWNTFVWFATLVTMADGLARVGFIDYVASSLASAIGWMQPTQALIVLLTVFYWIHYLFASLTAHVTALYPVFIATATKLGISPTLAAYTLAYELGIMGVISPYATGPAPIYYGSGYVKSSEFWKLGLIFGVIFYAVYIVLGLPIAMILIR
jgi:L-tartrate/succinate antiporter